MRSSEPTNETSNNMDNNNTHNTLTDDDGSPVDLSFLDRPLMSRANTSFSYYKTVEHCSRDGIQSLMDNKVKHLLKALTQPNSGVKLRNGLDFKFCSIDPFYPKEFRSFPIGGYYSPTQEHIVICCDRMANEKALKETIAHEMVHVYDLARFGDLEDCNVRACTEIRAYNLTGTCENAKYDSRYQYSREECVKYHSLLSTVPMCGPQGRISMDQVFTSCFQDQTPFDMSRPSNPARLPYRKSPNRF